MLENNAVNAKPYQIYLSVAAILDNQIFLAVSYDFVFGYSLYRQ